MNEQSIAKIEKLIKKGVRIPNPGSIDIGVEVDTERISGDGVVIYSGCKIYGNSTLILRGTRLGYESPVTLEDCLVGPSVSLRGGFFSGAVFLEKASLGLNAHVREGTIVEEEANTAHTVALKHTILFPFVTLGSLINFCDCFMAGGTSRKDHSEVGSSYIHFNYTPNQDKATPSLIGNVPLGVMLNQRPIFLGGQGGLVGPTRVAFGTTIAAGSICRHDVLEPGYLLFEGSSQSGKMHFEPGLYRNIKRIMSNNVIYIANLIALRQWYCHVRVMFLSNDFPEAILDGLKQNLGKAINERIFRLKSFRDQLPESVAIFRKMVEKDREPFGLRQQKELYEKWPAMEEAFETQLAFEGDLTRRDQFLKNLQACAQTHGNKYIATIKNIPAEVAEMGTQWLQGIVDHVTTEIIKIVPSLTPGERKRFIAD
ncbi:hypothetical protein ACFL9U_09790 [Thermodesulfobacteriota bacterium]